MKENSSLAISKAGKKALSKNQQEFNKLTKKIEKLQIEIEKKSSNADLALQKMGAELYPLKNNLAIERREHVLLLWKHFEEKKLSKSNQKYLKNIISDQIDFLFNDLEGEPDAQIKHIYKHIENEDFDELVKEEQAKANEEMVNTLKAYGVDISDVDVNDPESLLKKLNENKSKIIEDINQKKNFHNAKKEKKKTAKQIAAENLQQEADDLQKKDISAIYKQLAKLFHPDLEQDEERKSEKMLLMQELTAAYEAKNLHALLRLELKWIHNQNNHLDSLTEDKLAVYLKILKDQAADLTRQQQEILYKPQYRILLEEFEFVMIQSPLKLVLNKIEDYKEQVEILKEQNKLISSEQALRHLNKLIKEWKLMEEDADFLFDMFFE